MWLKFVYRNLHKSSSSELKDTWEVSTVEMIFIGPKLNKKKTESHFILSHQKALCYTYIMIFQIKEICHIK